jgi:hypothetical protein
MGGTVDGLLREVSLYIIWQLNNLTNVKKMQPPSGNRCCDLYTYSSVYVMPVNITGNHFLQVFSVLHWSEYLK